MSKLVGYKQRQEHFNSIPKIESEINELSSIGTCRYDPKAYKTANIEDFLKRPLKYNFDITVKNKDTMSLFQHSCYFDTKEEAEKIHKKLRIKYFDQLTKPYLKKLSSNTKNISTFDQDDILNIFKKFDDLKLAL